MNYSLNSGINLKKTFWSDILSHVIKNLKKYIIIIRDVWKH